MMVGGFQWTEHAIQRGARRNLAEGDILFVLEHGRRFHCGGALHVFLGWRDIPRGKAIDRRFGHLQGTTLVLARDEAGPVLITAYRNRKAPRRLRAKRKFDAVHCR